MKKPTVLIAGTLAVVLGLPVAVIFGFFIAGSLALQHGTGGTTGACDVGTSLTPIGNLPGSVAGYSGEQLQNAAVILQVGNQRQLPARAQTIAVMTAMGESGMKNINYGDDIHGVKNPDGTPTSSIGMFQEQKWFGSVESRLDPVQSSGRFYDRLLGVRGWDALEPTIAAHKAQRNANPYHYAKYWPAAVEVVTALSGSTPTAPAPEVIVATDPTAALASPALPGLGAVGQCAGDGTINAGGPLIAGDWASPTIGQNRSGFGPRNTGIPGASKYHQGDDISNDCKTPIYAATSGRVVLSGSTKWGTGNTIKIEHAGGYATLYGHLLSGTLLVSVGQNVTTGQQIASMGGDKRIDPVGAGTSSGCHLHFEVHENGTPINPTQFYNARAIKLGAASTA